MCGTPPGEASAQGGPGSLSQAEGRTCEDLQDEDHYSSSPDSSFSPSDGDHSTTSSSLSLDSLTTEGNVGEGGRRSRGDGPLPWSSTISDRGCLGEQELPCPFTDEGPEAQRGGSLAGGKQDQVSNEWTPRQALMALFAQVRAVG